MYTSYDTINASYQGFDGAEVFNFVTAEVEMGEGGTLLSQYLQTPWDSVIAKLELWKTWFSAILKRLAKTHNPKNIFDTSEVAPITFLSLFSFGKLATDVKPTVDCA